MAKTVIINGNIYPDAPYVDIPKSDSSGDARFYDTTDATATAAHTLAGDTFYNDGLKTGSMPNNGDTSGTISTKNGTVSIPSGFTSGGTVGISTTEKNKIIAGNIKNGITILGVTGDYGGEQAVVQAKTATPTSSQQVVLPDTGYDYLTQVTVNAVPYTETLNSAGGYTATIL
jgi:hypothetical protein